MSFSIQLLGVALLASIMAVIGLVKGADAGTLTTIWNFNGGPTDGGVPTAPLVAYNGALYGTTSSGGASGYGIVFKLTQSGGKWTETILHNFLGQPNDGIGPTNIVIGSAGEIYGSTTAGGVCVCSGGVVYELVEPANKLPPWTETILYQFTGGGNGTTTDGSNPAGVALNSKGYLLGTTTNGGSSLKCGNSNGQPLGCGTFFKLTPPAAGGTPWIESKINFDKKNGAFPLSPPTIGSGGYAFISTVQGGSSSASAQGRLSGVSADTNADGDGDDPIYCENVDFPLAVALSFTSAFYFTANSGNNPVGQPTERPLTEDEQGKVKAWCSAKGGSLSASDPESSSTAASTAARPFLFGTASGGGKPTGCPALFNSGCGLVYGLTPPATGGGEWTETILHDFSGGADGAMPEGALFLDKSGVLWGTTYGADTSSDHGTIFKLTPDTSSSTGYTYAVVHRFNSTDGATPQAGLIEMKGVLYGTTSFGGSASQGTVFAYTP